MKVGTKLNIRQTVFRIRENKIYPVIVNRIRIIRDTDPKCDLTEYTFRYGEGSSSFDVLEKNLSNTDIFNRKEDAKLELYKRIAEM